MARKKTTDVPSESGTAEAQPETMTPPGDVSPEPASPEPNGMTSDSSPPVNGNGNGERKPLKVFSYLVGPSTYVQCSVWQRDAQRRDGTTFTTYDCSVRKRYVDQRDGEWKSLYSFHASELYAVQHALERAAAFIAELRAADVPF